jgi:hypothetical protein
VTLYQYFKTLFQRPFPVRMLYEHASSSQQLWRYDYLKCRLTWKVFIVYIFAYLFYLCSYWKKILQLKITAVSLDEHPDSFNYERCNIMKKFLKCPCLLTCAVF